MTKRNISTLSAATAQIVLNRFSNAIEEEPRYAKRFGLKQRTPEAILHSVVKGFIQTISEVTDCFPEDAEYSRGMAEVAEFYDKHAARFPDVQRNIDLVKA